MNQENHHRPEIEVSGHIETGRNFDVEINLPGDNRDSIYGIIKDPHNEPVEDAVVQLVEIRRGERRPVSHTFTNEAGEFVFGPLCPTRRYEILFWASEVEHVKMCKSTEREGSCLKGVRLHCDRPRPSHPCREGRECDERREQ